MAGLKMTKSLDEDYLDPSNHTDASWLNIQDFLQIPFTRPEPLQSFLTPILKLESKQTPTDYFTVGSLKIVSAAFRFLLETAGAEFEFFSVKLLTHCNTPFGEHSYYFGHLLKVVDCFDYARLSYEISEYAPSYIQRVNSLGISEDLVKHVPAFWIKNVAFGNWLINDELAAQITASGLTGIDLLDLDHAIAK